MDSWYWISEYIKVLVGYLFLMFLWPLVVFHGHLRTRSKTYRFGFCVTVPIVIANVTVLMLGLFHGLNQWGVRLIFYGVFILALLMNIMSCFDRRYKRLMEAKFLDIRRLKGKYRALVRILLFFVVSGRYIKKAARFLSCDFRRKIESCNRRRIRLGIKRKFWNFRKRTGFLFWKYGILAAVILYGMAYFSYGAFQMHSYGSGDLYIHHGWIYGLIEGNIFPDGIYPEAMHCFVYCIHTLFGIKIYSILLFLQGIHVAVFLLSVYLLLKKIFYWQYTPVFVLMLFLTWDVYNTYIIRSMFRLQITLPMEFALHTVCLSALYLSEYLETEQADAAKRDKRQLKYIWNEKLFLFFMSYTAVIMTHFHTALMSVIVCASFAVCALKKVCSKNYLIPLVSAVLCAGMIAAAPMAGALVQGVPFNASINWAINAMYEETDRTGEQREETDSTDDAAGETDKKERDDVLRSEISIAAVVVSGLTKIYEKGYTALYGRERGIRAMILTAAAIVICWFGRKKDRVGYLHKICRGYPPVIIVSVLHVILYAAPALGLPDLLPEGRFSGLGHMMLLAVMVMPADIIFSGLLYYGRETVLRLLSLLSVLGIYEMAVITGSFRGLLYYELSRYEPAAAVTESIIETLPRYSYTIISPTDELYPVIQYGWHEELLTFLEGCGKGKYTVPSEYVFIYVEKKPLFYAQLHFFEGPSWMGGENYGTLFKEMCSRGYLDNAVSQSPEILTSEISAEAADMELSEYKTAWEMYTQPENRTVLESKAYEWCRRFAEEHPSVLNIYYEDDSFVCYYFRQDAGKPPYELGLEE